MLPTQLTILRTRGYSNAPRYSGPQIAWDPFWGLVAYPMRIDQAAEGLFPIPRGGVGGAEEHSAKS